MSRRVAKVLQIEPEARPAPARYGSPATMTVLPWKDAAELEALLAELDAEHRPEGPTERHLVEELASVMWRSRRPGLAEAALYRAGLHDAVSSFRAERTVQRALAHVGGKGAGTAAAAVQATPEDTAAEMQDLDADQTMTEEALRRLRAGGEGACHRALEALREDTRAWWGRVLEEGGSGPNEVPYAADAGSLRRFLEAEAGAITSSAGRSRTAPLGAVSGPSTDVNLVSSEMASFQARSSPSFATSAAWYSRSARRAAIQPAAGRPAQREGEFGQITAASASCTCWPCTATA